MSAAVDISPKNKEQEDAITSGMLFLEKGDPDEWFVIVGKAGTGKTTIAQLLLKGYVKKHKILVCALSHKAKLVISEKLIKAYSEKNIVSKSVAGALGMKMDAESGKFTFDQNNDQPPPIRSASIIIIDECSMINEESHELIMRHKKRKAKVIYLGDIRQLSPIRESNNLNLSKPSPVFYGKNIAILNERIRQGEESPILPFADFFGNNSRIHQPAENPVPLHARKNIVTEKGALVFVQNQGNAVEACMPLFKYAVDNNKPDTIKVVTYRNNTRDAINVMIRMALFGDDIFDQQYVKGDLLMFQDNYNIDGADEPISNSFEVQAVGVKEAIDGNYKIWEVEIVYEAKPAIIKVLDKSETKKHAADVSRLFEIAKGLSFGSWERSEALGKAWGLKNRYAPIEFAYAITSHKSQGSTYNTVIVDERDIMSVKPISNKEKSQSMYTAITRASTTCIVHDGQIADHTLAQAVALSQQKILALDG